MTFDGSKKGIVGLGLVLLLWVCLAGCQSPYIGAPVDYRNKGVCICGSFPKSCTMAMEHVVISYTVDRGETENEYVFKGKMSWIGGSTWTSFQRAQVKLLLIKNEVLDALSFPVSSFGKSIESTIHFNKAFTTEHKFDAVVVGYFINVMG